MAEKKACPRKRGHLADLPENVDLFCHNCVLYYAVADKCMQVDK
jgi:uncharacterized protein YbaR (Trm112 family)